MKKKENKLKLTFKVDPDYLRDRTYVPNPVKIVIIDPEAIFLTGILGESGRKMVQHGFPFIFTKKLAQKLIDKGIAKEVK